MTNFAGGTDADRVAGQAVAGQSVPVQSAATPSDQPSVERLASMGPAELDRLGTQLDHTEVVVLSVGPPPGSIAEKRAERQVAICFTLATVFALAFVVVFWGAGWFLPDWEYRIDGSAFGSLFTPLLGLTMGGALAFLGIGIVLWAKKLMPHEVAIQERHGGASPPLDARTAGGTILAGFQRTGAVRHKMARRSLFGAGGALGLLALMPLGGLIKNPSRGDELMKTSWSKGVRLLRDDGTPVRPSDMQPGSLETVFPAVEGGNRQADAATMLIRLRREQVEAVEAPSGQEDFAWEDYLAFSKICTHAGCPVSLYEQETGRILCPCHQSQFDVTRGATPTFGPAARALPQLPIEIDDEGFFVARSDYPEPVGPSFWNRET